MSWLRHWKIALCMAAIFVAGGVTGSVLTVRAVRAFVNRQATPEAWLTTMVRGYEKKLKLTSEQAQKLKPSFDQAGMELRRARASTMMDYVEIVQRLQEEIGR
jgi:Spy/CpxP family protein refolding chaperone